MPMYDHNGKVIGTIPQSNQPQNKDFLTSLVTGITDPLSRLQRGISNVSAKATGGNQNYLNSQETEDYKNPWNVAKDVASAGSLVIPGGGLKSLIGAGAAQGFGSSYGNDNATDSLKSTLAGGAMGGALGKALPFLGKMFGKGGSQVAEQAATKPSFLRNAGNALEDSGIGNDISKTGKFTEGEAKQALVGDTLRKYGVKDLNKAKAVDKATNLVGSDLGKAYETHSKQIGKIFDANDIASTVDQNAINRVAFEKFGDVSPENIAKVKNLLRDELGSFGDSANGIVNKNSKLDANGLWKYVRDNADIVQKVKSGKTVSAIDEARMSLYETAKDILNNEPSLSGLQDLNAQYGALKAVQKPTASIQRQGQTTRLPGFGSGIGNEAGIGLPLGNVMTGAKTIAGRGLNKAADLVEGKGLQIPGLEKAMPFLNNPLVQRGVVGAGLNATQSQEQPDQMESSQMDQSQMQQDPAIAEQADRYQQAFELYFQMFEGDAAKAAQQAEALTGYSPEGDTKNLSSADRKLQSYANSGLNSLDTIEQILTSDSGSQFGAQLPGPLGFLKSANSRQLETAISNAADSIGRLRSGGALNKDEEARFRAQLPTMFDDPETVKMKLNSIRNDLQAVLV